MTKFIISWDCGNCTDHAVVDVDSLAEAERIAKDEWESDNQRSDLYWAEPWTKERSDELALDDED